MPSTNEYQKKIRKRWKRKGLCSMCGVQPANRKGKLTCSDCAVRYATYSRKLKRAALAGYGSKCACCGTEVFEFLSFDHVNNDGAAERKAKGKKMISGSLYRLIVRENFPNRYQVLCHNCNLSLGFYGYCPHRPEIKRDTSKSV